MKNIITVLGISGSIRKNSYNTLVLNTAQKLSPENMEVMVFGRLGEIPIFNQDYENNPPEVVVDFKNQIKSADAILISTPEYNYSIPGVLKNAIDWASRPYGDSAWEGKPAAIMSASSGMMGGVRAQLNLRQIFIFLNMFPLNRPEVIVPEISKKIDSNENLTDEHTKEKIKELLDALYKWTLKLKQKVFSPEDLTTEEFPYHHAYNRRTKSKI